VVHYQVLSVCDLDSFSSDAGSRRRIAHFASERELRKEIVAQKELRFDGADLVE